MTADAGMRSAVQSAAAALLVLHQRMDESGCLCGWAVLGASHTDHVAQVLGDAGLLAAPPTRSSS